MTKEYKQFDEHMSRALNVLISSHLSPDHDSIASSLVLKRLLKQKYPDLNITIAFEQKWGDSSRSLDFPMEEIELASDVDFSVHDTVILVDVYELSRTFHSEAERVTDQYVIAIDHHKISAEPSCDLLIQEDASSAVEVVYNLFYGLMGDKLEITQEVAKFIQFGILLDTNRFQWYSSPELYELMAKMGRITQVDTEGLFYDAVTYSKVSVYLFNHILGNAEFKDDFVYTYIDEKNVTDIESYTRREMNDAAWLFLNDISRHIDGVTWSFLLKGSSQDPTMWRVSFRAIKGKMNILPFAEKLGGGGHESAASGVIHADTPKEAVEKVLEIIS